MDPTTQRLLSAGGVSAPVYVEDVFSVDLWEGNFTAGRQISNGLDMLGDGGFLQVRNRTDSSIDWPVSYTGNTFMYQNDNDLESAGDGNLIEAFLSNGFQLGSSSLVNGNSKEYVGYSWRKASKFFDIVTFTGTGSVQQISHSLGAIPRMIWVKKTSGTGNWICGTEEAGWDKYLFVNTNGIAVTDSTVWDSTSPTATAFTVGTSTLTNTSGNEYVAFIWSGGADSAAFGENGDEQILKIGSYSGSGIAQSIDVGFQPQFLVIKTITGAGDDWYVFDAMRGMEVVDADEYLEWNSQNGETVNISTNIRARDDGFDLVAETGINTSGRDYLYIAVRKEGGKPISSSSDFFNFEHYTGDGTGSRTFTTDFDADLAMVKQEGTSNYQWQATGFDFSDTIETDTGNAANSTGDLKLTPTISRTLEVDTSVNSNSTNNWLAWWKAAGGALDVVNYVGNNAEQTHEHALRVVPQMIWVKNYTSTTEWRVYHSAMGTGFYGRLDTNAVFTSTSNSWGSGPTATEFTTGVDGNLDGNGAVHTAWLWGNVPGIIDIGSYEGTGGSQVIDCGFSAGTKWVMIKNADAVGNWIVIDNEKGLTGGSSDEYYVLDVNQAPVSATALNQDNSGFEVVDTTSLLNSSGQTYIYMAIAA